MAQIGGMEQMGGDMNELMSTKMCSPLMIYIAIVVTSGLSVYLTRSSLMRHNTNKMDNLYNLYSMNELKFVIIFGLILFGLCQYNKANLAWVFLIFPVIYVLIQNLIIHIHVSSAVQSAPKLLTLNVQQQPSAQIIPQDTQQSQPPVNQPMVPPQVRSVDTPRSTSVSQPMGGSNIGSGGMGGFAYI
jgi:hypothetical protein